MSLDQALPDFRGRGFTGTLSSRILSPVRFFCRRRATVGCYVHRQDHPLRWLERVNRSSDCSPVASPYPGATGVLLMPVTPMVRAMRTGGLLAWSHVEVGTLFRPFLFWRHLPIAPWLLDHCVPAEIVMCIVRVRFDDEWRHRCFAYDHSCWAIISTNAAHVHP